MHLYVLVRTQLLHYTCIDDLIHHQLSVFLLLLIWISLLLFLFIILSLLLLLPPLVILHMVNLESIQLDEEIRVKLLKQGLFRPLHEHFLGAPRIVLIGIGPQYLHHLLLVFPRQLILCQVYLH